MIGHGADLFAILPVEGRLAALLYHPGCPCANPAQGIKMNKQQASRVRATSWQTD
jgi:hypothetical protein